MYYTKSSLISYTKKMMEEKGFIAVKYDLSRVWRNFNDIPTDGSVRYFLIHEVGTKAGTKYGFDIDLLPQYSTCLKKDPRDAKGIFAELLENLDQILAGDYVSKAVSSKQKKIESEARKKAKEEMLEADCKTFKVDFFDENGSYLDSIIEIGRRLQNGQYSDLVLNDLITLSYRTKSKNRNLGYTVTVIIDNKGITYTYDNKYGDLWEDLDDNIRKDILRRLLNYGCFEEKEVDMSFARSEWIDKFVVAEKDGDQNPIMYDLLSIYFSPDSFYFDKGTRFSCYRNTYDKGDLNLGNVLRDYFCSSFPDVKWLNQELRKLSNVPALSGYFNKESNKE